MTATTRKSHKKSKKGCVLCKRRHVKCDERRPACGNCSVTERYCFYEETPASQSQSSGCISLPNTTKTPTISEDDSSISPSSRSTPDSDYDSSPVNMLHLELLRHFISKDLTLFGYDKSIFGTFNSETIDTLFITPYLTNQILAFAALHLSVSSPTRKREFQHHSSQLRSHALTLFRSEELKVEIENALPVFLFTSIRAFHVFSEKITLRQEQFGDFLRDFIDILHLHQQVREVTNQSWRFLLESPLKSLLEKEASALMQEVPLMECSQLFELVNSASIDSSARDTYLEAIKSLQMAINGSRRHSLEQSTIGPIISWLVVMPSDYICLLAEKRPEALIILAHFGALLYLHSGIWAVGDSGLYVIDSISSYLGCAWDAWLHWPKTIAQCE